MAKIGGRESDKLQTLIRGKRKIREWGKVATAVQHPHEGRPVGGNKQIATEAAESRRRECQTYWSEGIQGKQILSATGGIDGRDTRRRASETDDQVAANRTKPAGAMASEAGKKLPEE